MDLNYADQTKDIGVLHGYQFDMAFGRDENDFELMIPSKKHCLKENYKIFIDNTEYGGIIDSILDDEKEEEIVYKGRTWHGILNSKVIEPDLGQEYYTVNGDANEIINDILKKIDLTDIFEVSADESEIEISEYQFEPYVKAYTGILDMLITNDAKLCMKFLKGKIKISVEPNLDYSQDEEFDNDTMDFSMERNYRPVNHLICVNQGEASAEKYIIHLYMDENGGIQPYTIKEPINDADYILDNRNKILSGIYEITDVLEQSGSSYKENYVILLKQPLDWWKNYNNYYSHSFDDDGTDKFEKVESEEKETYTLLSSKPDDWNSNYTTYFYLENGEYKTAEGTETESYKRMSSKPSDWNKNYGDYYYYYSDGVTAEYKSVEGISKEKYALQTMKPSDWNGNFKSYFRRTTAKERRNNKKLGTYIAVSGVGNNKKKTPTWTRNRYYTKISYTATPAFKTYYYKKVATSNIPTWASGKYYSQKTIQVIPSFTSGTFYKKEIDHYAPLIEEALKKVEEYKNCDNIDFDFHPDNDVEYDINDIVGATSITTGISCAQHITKKIIKINENEQSIEYEIGGNNG